MLIGQLYYRAILAHDAGNN